MKKKDIKIGKRYTDNKGNVREVLDIGHQYLLYPSQESNECLRYKLVEKKIGPYLLGSENNCTFQSFASWAKTEVID